MEQEPGDDYIRRLASFIRTNEKSLAEYGAFTRRRRLPQRSASMDATSALSVLNPLGWFGYDTSSASAPKPVVLSIDTHHLFYVLMRLEGIGMNIGTLDVEIENPSRPTSYINIPETDKSDTLSLSSIRSSLSAMSNLSLGAGWWGRPEPPSIEAELKYIFSSFTKLPALSVSAPSRKVVAELANEPPNRNALPLDVFKNVQSLECNDIDPRTLLGWDRLAEGLRSLKIKKSGLEDVTDIFVGAVVDDQARREGSRSRRRQRRIPRGTGEGQFYAIDLPESVPEDADGEAASTVDQDDTSSSPPPSTRLSSLKWAFLKHLSLADNSLTFFPIESIPYLTSITHLDLSSNLLVSIPSGLSALFNLVSLNLSDNMIDSVLGIYKHLGQVLHLNLGCNRLESICGLERLHALERVDLRHNLIEDSAEIGRLAPLPYIAEVWVEGNPFVEMEENYRVVCFDYFWKEGKTILLDGTPPGFYEKRNLTMPPPPQMTSSRPVSVAASSPPVVPVGHGPPLLTPPLSSKDGSPQLGPVNVVGRARKKKQRIVDLDGEGSDDAGSSRSASHARVKSDASDVGKGRMRAKVHGPGKEKVNGDRVEGASEDADSGQTPRPSTITPLPSRADPPRILPRHSRYQTEYIPSSAVEPPTPPSPSGSPTSPSGSPTFRRTRGSATFASRSGVRRARVSASLYEAPGSVSDGEEGGRDLRTDAEAYRKRIEALKQDMGDGWLKVFSQRL